MCKPLIESDTNVFVQRAHGLVHEWQIPRIRNDKQGTLLFAYVSDFHLALCIHPLAGGGASTLPPMALTREPVSKGLCMVLVLLTCGFKIHFIVTCAKLLFKALVPNR